MSSDGAPLDFNGAFRKKRVEPVWEHTCGGQSYYLHEDGRIECFRCHEVLSKVWIESTEAEDHKEHTK